MSKDEAIISLKAKIALLEKKGGDVAGLKDKLARLAEVPVPVATRRRRRVEHED